MADSMISFKSIARMVRLLRLPPLGVAPSESADIADSTSMTEGNSSSGSTSPTPTFKYDLKAPEWFLNKHVYLNEDLDSFRPKVKLVAQQSADDEHSSRTRFQKIEASQAEDHLNTAVVLSEDVYDELEDLVGCLEESGAGSTVVFSTDDVGCDHVARALLATYAAKNGADIITINFEMLENLAIDLYEQVESQERAEHQASDGLLDALSDKKPGHPSKDANEVDGGDENADLAEDRPRKDISRPLESFFYAPEVHLGTSSADSDANDDSEAAVQPNMRKKVAQARQIASAKVILDAVKHKKSNTHTDKAGPLLVLLEAVYKFSAKERWYKDMVRMLVTRIECMLSEGQVVRFFISTTSANVQDMYHSYGLWGHSNLKTYKAEETSVMKLQGDFAREPYAKSHLHFHKVIADLKQAGAQLRTQQPTFVQLSRIETCSNALQKHGTIAHIVKQLQGRYAKTKALSIENIVEITQRVARRAPRSLEDGPEEVDLDDHEKHLFATKIDASQIEETFEDVIMDDKVLGTLQLRLELALLPARDLPRGLMEGLHTPGILLQGPPGTGKTQLVRAIANSKKATMLAIQGADVRDKFVGETEKLIKAAFSLARKLHPCILFFDEADALFYRRTSEDMLWQRIAANQFLAEMDGLTKLDRHPIVVVATNRMEDIDKAFLRRLPHHIAFDLPNEDQRARMFQLHSRQALLDPDVEFHALAELAVGMSGSDIQNLCQSAVLESYFDRKSDSNSTDLDASDLLVRHSHFLRALRSQSQNLRQVKQTTQHTDPND